MKEIHGFFSLRPVGDIGALCVVGVLASVWGYHSTKQLREMRKKLSDDAREAPLSNSVSKVFFD